MLSQYALLWAADNPSLVERLIILNTPLAPRAKLRPELAAYKNPVPFMRPKADVRGAAGAVRAGVGRARAAGQALEVAQPGACEGARGRQAAPRCASPRPSPASTPPSLVAAPHAPAMGRRRLTA